MQPNDTAGTSTDLTKFRGSFRNAGLVFAALGLAAILAPVIATLVIEQMVAWLLLFWGIAGLGFAWSFRNVLEWRIALVFFIGVLITGLVFVFFPSRGVSFITGIIVIVLFLEGVLSIWLGLKLRGQLPNWLWVIASGACAFLLGAIILVQWPTSSTWLLGFLTGLNFLSTGVSMVMLSIVQGKQA